MSMSGFEKLFATCSKKHFQENCSMGCPCENYICDLPEEKAILVLNTWGSTTLPILIQPNGNFRNRSSEPENIYLRWCYGEL